MQSASLSLLEHTLGGAKVTELIMWLKQVVDRAGELDPRSGTIWMSPQLYATKGKLYDDYKVDLLEQVLDMGLNPEAKASLPPSIASFYKVCLKSHKIIKVDFLLMGASCI